MSEIKALDSLREWVRHICENPHLGALSEMGRQGLRNIADGIQAEVDSRYMERPCDKNGVPIRIADNLHSDEIGRDFLCRGYNMRLNGRNEKWWTVECCYDAHSGTSEYVSAKSCHHAEPRTLEDVLSEYGRAYYAHMVDGYMNYDGTDEPLTSKYAAEIRELLCGDAE